MSNTGLEMNNGAASSYETIHGQRRRARTGASRRPSAGNAELNKLSEQINAVFEKDNAANALTTVNACVLPGHMHRLNASGIIITNVKGNVVVFHPVLMEEYSDAKVGSKVLRERGQHGGDISTPLALAECANEEMEIAIRNIIVDNYAATLLSGMDSVTFEYAGFSVVKKGADIEQACFIAAEACLTKLDELDLLDGERVVVAPIDLKTDERGDKVNLVNYVNFNKGTQVTEEGNLARTDVTVETVALNNAGAPGDNSHHRTGVVTTSGYMDYLFRAPHQVQMPDPVLAGIQVPYMNPQFQQQQPALAPTVQFLANFIITDIYMPSLNYVLPSLESYLLGINNAAYLGHGRDAQLPYPLWYDIAKPTEMRENVMDVKDLGAIGYELPNENGEAKEFKIKSTEFVQKGELKRWLATYMGTEMQVSVDVPSSGAMGYHLEPFVQLANVKGRTHEEDVAIAERRAFARERIIKAANNVTNGLFSKYFGNEEIILGNPLRMQIGSISGPDGELDSREIDYIAALNQTAGDAVALERAREFSRSFEGRTDLSPSKVVADRDAELSYYSNNTYKFDTWVSRVTLSPAFLAAFAQAVAEAGILPAIHEEHRQHFESARGYQVQGTAGINNQTFSGIIKTANPYPQQTQQQYAGGTAYGRSQY